MRNIFKRVFKSNHLRIYEKEYWRLSGFERIIIKGHQISLFDKREISSDKLSACEKRLETFLLKKCNGKTG